MGADVSENRVPDVHCHLESLADAEAAVAEAVAAGVGPILAVGMEAASSTRSLALAARFPLQVRAGVGLHPSEVPALDDSGLAAELAFVEAQLAGATLLGEVGLDYKDATDDRQRARQRDALAIQLAWAARWRKPVSMHCRRAEHDVMDVAARFVRDTGLGLNLHWFTHSARLAGECARAGIFISPGPSILESESQAVVARAIANDWLLLETDSPVVFGGAAARPAWARRVAEHLAMLRGVSYDLLAAQLQSNLARYLGTSA
jgi:TatD DNase family protein